MSSLRSYVLALVALVVTSCSIENPKDPAAPCGMDGQRCCSAADMATGLMSNGCATDHQCVAGAPSGMDGGTGRVCRRCPSDRPNACITSALPGGTCVNLATDRSNCGMCGMACPAGQECSPATSSSPDGGVRDAGASGRGMCRQVCPAGQTFCPGAGCVDTRVNPNHCSACGIMCQQGRQCTGGMCECPAGQSFCAGVGCVDLQTAMANCGMCGRACNTGESCRGGMCSCPIAGQTFCAGTGCTNLMSDTRNCGSCGTACPPGQACANGRCNCSITGQIFCPGVGCTNPMVDTNNCGSCGTQCRPGESCTGGRCICGIPGQTFCMGSGCTNLQTDVSNCGACGTACPAGQTCTTGRCVCPIMGQTFCMGLGCIDLQNDTRNCGRCNNACPEGQVCATGTCRCPTGLTLCGGACVDVTTNASHCGSCNNSCSGAPNFPNAVGTCGARMCAQTACLPGFGNCNTAPGCETNVNSDPNNCGACNNRCRFANAVANCVSGACAMGTCNPGFADCNRDPSDGCETNVNTDTSNCGMCGRTCPSAPGRAATCTAGVCGLGAMCAAPTLDCDGLAGNGCEVSNSTTDINNCGGCARQCNRTNGTPTCAGGSCVAIACNAGFGNCDVSVNNGCEVDLSSTVNHCGSCGNRCVYANAAASCVTGRCTMGACSPGFADCDRSDTNGCETGTTSDNNNCGACGRVCTGGQVCTMGACACPAGLTLCNGTCVNVRGSDNANCGACGVACTGGQSCSMGTCLCPTGQSFCGGRCTDTQTDNNHCGMCGRTCSTGQRCSAGACVASCGAGTTDCSSVMAGCVNTSNNIAHCGACGRACSATNGTPGCTSGACTIMCTPGFGNCDNNAANGCEVAFNTVPNCGACGRVCNAGLIANGTAFLCPTGVCQVSDCAAGFVPGRTVDGNTMCVPCGGNNQPVCSAPDPQCSPGHVPNPLASGTCVSCGAQGQPSCASGCNTGLNACSVTMSGTTYDQCFNLQTTANRCGSCSASCPNNAETTGTCTMGRCTCANNAGDCDANRANGCEVIDLRTNTAHCGACGNACTTGQTCMGGMCMGP